MRRRNRNRRNEGKRKMKNELKMPAHCAVVSEDEMTYVEGGSDLDALSTAATVVGAVVLVLSHVWGIGTARSRLNQKENRKDVFTVIGRALDDIGEDMSQSPSNFLRDVVSTAPAAGLAPVTWC